MAADVVMLTNDYWNDSKAVMKHVNMTDDQIAIALATQVAPPTLTPEKRERLREQFRDELLASDPCRDKNGYIFAYVQDRMRDDPNLPLSIPQSDIAKLNDSFSEEENKNDWLFCNEATDKMLDLFIDEYLVYMHLRKIVWVVHSSATGEPPKLQPPQMLDLLWHTHITDTRNYMEFCLSYFGQYLHHEPGYYASKENGDLITEDEYERYQKVVHGYASWWESNFGDCG